MKNKTHLKKNAIWNESCLKKFDKSLGENDEPETNGTSEWRKKIYTIYIQFRAFSFIFD